jgi:carbon-monoxide dehydrogenase medium subunit
VIAGGQSLMPLLAFRLAAPSMLVDLRRIPGLDRITVGADSVTLGAMVRWRQIEESAELRAALPLLPAAIAHVAHYQIRNRGTVGGSLAHFDPAAEMPGLAVACDAAVVIAGASGTRTLPAAEFLLAPLMTALEPDEIIVAVQFPRWSAGRRFAFEEFARRRGDFALAAVALSYDQGADGRAADAHIGVIGATETPRRIAEAEAVLNGRRVDAETITAVADAAAAAVEPVDDLHASGAYRRALVNALVERALSAAAART